MKVSEVEPTPRAWSGLELNRFSAMVLGMPANTVIALWEKAGKPAIRLDNLMVCHNLPGLLKNELIYTYYPVIQDWLSEQ